MEEIRMKLDREIETEIEGLCVLEAGSEEKAKAIDGLATLYKLRLDEAKTEKEFEEKWHRRVMDTEEHDSQVRHQRIRFIIDGVGVVLPLAFYAFWMKKGFKFEETGTFTSTTFRGLFNKFKPGK